jgi:hypothetical protein
MRNISLILLVAGCATDDLQPDETIVDDTDEQIESVVTDDATPYQFGSTVYAGGSGRKTTRIESSWTHTCYLRGIRGALKGTEDSWGDRITAYAKLEINPSTGDWEAKTYPGYGLEVFVDVSCVRSTYNRKFLYRVASNNANSAEVTSMRRCFLTGIEARGQAMHWRDWDNSLPGAKVSTDRGVWAVDTFFHDNTDDYVDGSAYAVCFDDAGGQTGLHYIENGSDEIFDGASTDWACGAQGIFGIMKSGDRTAGARSYKQNNRWWASGTTNRGVLTKCYE